MKEYNLQQSKTTGKTYLVTGCAGFIASRIVMRLLEQGNYVVGLDNLNDYYDVRLKHHRLKQLNHENFVFIEADIEDRTELKKLFDGFEFNAVMNLAARAGVRYSMDNPHVYMTTNAIGSLNLLEEMRSRGVRKYFLASTSSLYAGLPMPFDESLSVNAPISPYAASKKAAEVMAYTYHYLYGLDVSICRYFTVYGPAGRPDMGIYRFIQWIERGQPIELYGDGNQARDFTFVDDIADGSIAALRDVGYQIFNLGGGNTPVTISEVIHHLEKLLNRKAIVSLGNFHKADMMTTAANISKAGEMLNWIPKTDLITGLQKTVQWHQENQKWLNSDH